MGHVSCGRSCEFECGGICDMAIGHVGKHMCGTGDLDRGPCSICGRMFIDCKCTAEQQIEAWRKWFAENFSREEAEALLRHPEDDE